MRSRPDVKVYLKPGVVGPGERIVAETVLTSKSETPIDFVEMRLRGVLRSAAGQGNYRQLYEAQLFDSQWRSKPETLTEGEHRFKVGFDIKPDAAPSYQGADASIVYELGVHVSIPWWPDRRKTFVVPVKMPPITPGPHPLSAVYATSTEGPRGDAPFMEVALDATDIALGDVVTGRISVANLRGTAVRGIDLAFVEMETVTLPFAAARERGRFALRVFDGSPKEGEPIPFRVRVPERAMPSFIAGPIRVATHLEVRAVLAWVSDIVVRAPLAIAPAKRADRDVGRVAPVGRERMLAVWQAEAGRHGFVVDAEGDGMHGMLGPVRVRITSEHRDGDYWLVAELTGPSVGLDLDVTEKSWRDALAIGVVKTGIERIDKRFTVHAREHAQAKPFVDVFLPPLVAFEEAKAGDAITQLASRGSVHSTERVDSFVREVLAVADALEAARALVGPPALLAVDVPAWRAFAESISGRLELGRMWIHDGRIGMDAVSLGCTWDREGLLLGTTVRVALDPALDSTPSIDDPAISPAARDAWKLTVSRTKKVTVLPDLILCELEGKLTDPSSAMPIIESAVALRRALSGTMAAGPFR
jgi:hypothetical protein